MNETQWESFYRRHNDLPVTGAKPYFKPKPAGPATIERRRIERKFDARKNMCPTCHVAMPATGICC